MSAHGRSEALIVPTRRVLVTGAYGFIGRAYCAYLAARGIEYVGAVRQCNADETRDAIVGVGDFAEADWPSLLASHRIDDIVHLAARSHRMVDEHPDPKAAYTSANVVATQRLFDAACDAGISRFVHASTVKIHGDYTPPGVVWRESDPPDPKDEYAVSKVAAERIFVDAARDCKVDWVILRFPIVYGPGVKGSFASLLAGVKKRWPLPLGAIRNQRSLLGLDNACASIEAVRADPRATGQVFLISDGDDVSTPELVRAMADALGVRPRLLAVPTGILRTLLTLTGKRMIARRLVESLAIDSARIRRSLEWTPPSSLDDELQRLVRSLRRD